METIKITEDNLEEYAAYLDPDVAECIGREYYRGIAIHEDEDEPPRGTLIWELKNVEDEIATESELFYYSADSEDDGRQLFEAYAEEAEENEVERSFFELPEEKKKEKGLFEEQGFATRETEGMDLYVTVGELSEIPFTKKKVPSYITGISELMVRQFRKGITNCIFHGRKGILEDLEFLPMSWYDEDVSCCVQTDGRVTGFLLVNKRASGILVVDFLFALEPDARANLVSMIRFSVQAAAQKYPPETKVLIKRHNEMTHAVAKKLFPDKKGAPVLAGERREG